MRGRKPKPLALKILEGSRVDPGNFAQPHLPPGSTDPPAGMTGHALAKWCELAPVLSAAGLLTAGDRTALEQLCEEYATIKQHPHNSNSARDRLRRMLCEFGLTPSSRSRIKSTEKKPADRLEEFLAEGVMR